MNEHDGYPVGGPSLLHIQLDVRCPHETASARRSHLTRLPLANSGIDAKCGECAGNEEQ
jgi:hypothetical protein